MAAVSDAVDLPPGFRFHPTDEEIISHYLSPKIMNPSFTATAVGEVDLNKCEPWDLPSKAKMGEKEWYFFCQRDRKYPTGMRTNRATEAGYWKATGKDKEIFKGKGVLVGMKKTLVFYRGRAPKGEKTNWVMHEFRLEGKPANYINLSRASKDEWTVCKVVHKSTGAKKSLTGEDLEQDSPNQLPPLIDPSSYFNSINRSGLNYLGRDGGCLDYKGIPGSSPAMNSFGSNIASVDDLHNRNYNYPSFNQQVSNSGFYQQIPPQTPYFPLSRLAAGSGYLQQDAMLTALSATNNDAMRRHCKLEQFSSNQSMVSASQDTGLSTDRNTKISSVISKHNMGYDDLDDPTSAEPVIDLENIWKY